MSYYKKRVSMLNIMYALQGLGWEIYGYKPDYSDSMTDNFDPAYWEGIATKNGYILCINTNDYTVKTESGKDVYEYTDNTVQYENTINEKIKKLEALANDPAASQGEYGEANTARKKIIELMASLEQKRQSAEKSKILKEKWPEFQKNPGRCNWHIEKDGIIIDKGIGAYAFNSLPWEHDLYIMDWKKDKPYRLNNDEWENHKNDHADEIEHFKKFINRIDNAASPKIGKGNPEHYEKKVVTENKTGLKAREIKLENLSEDIKVGMCFKLQSSFNYGGYKGIYRIVEYSKFGFRAKRLNRKLTKTLEGRNINNRFNCTFEQFNNWIEIGAITIVEIVEEKIPIKVERWIRKKTF